jgi:hypothetical protein
MKQNVKDKFSSRKFQVWIVWLIFSVAALFVKRLPVDTIFSFFGAVSIVYIGGNVAQDYIFNNKKQSNGADGV